MIRKLKDDIYAVGAIDWDRRLFDELIPLPDGTTYNSYLIVGKDKTALIDTVDPTKVNELLRNLEELKIKKIDYVIAHHGEQDHSGSIPKILELFPMAKVVTNQKCKDFLKELLLVPDDKFIVVADRENLSLGGKTLEFILAPWVHWPETMFTYLKEEKLLFSCDFLGSHFASSSLFVKDEPRIKRSSKRYYAEIMMPFRPMIRKHLETLSTYQIEMIAPSHGPVYDKPKFILDAYKDWVSDDVKNEVVLPYVSMHGSTQAMVDHLIAALIQRGVTVKPFNLSKSDIGELAMALVDTATVIVGSPTVLAGPHPLAAYAAFLMNALRPKTRFVGVIGSYGWGGKMVEGLAGALYSLKVELYEPVVIKGYPKEADLQALDKFADEVVKKHAAIGARTCSLGKTGIC